MPVLLEGAVRFPTSYEPWYVYQATLVAAPTAYQFLDVLFPDAAGNFDRLETNDAVVDTGYVFALEKFTTGDLTVQVAVPGSAVPIIIGASVRPTQLVKFAFAATVQSFVAALAADIPLGRVFGRLRNHHEDHETLRVTVANDIGILLTGVI
ncbi:hypothetical protein LCGC14_0372830 [marine sediment metagenome]|uniref:Uncharacterized protein n=1 Tax=marine sediment metagenome TaxID=412755 RepID=A0A0F9TMU5_9ZZZZ